MKCSNLAERLEEYEATIASSMPPTDSAPRPAIVDAAPSAASRRPRRLALDYRAHPDPRRRAAPVPRR